MKNTILVTIDTLRKDMVSLYGKSSLTPFIDSLSSNLTIYSSAHPTGPYTQASFQGILASEYYLEYGKEKKLNPKKTLISEVLKDSGVYTAAFHSNAYLSYYFGYNKGWDTFYDSMSDDVTDMYPFIRGDGINKKVEEFLSGFSFDPPLFLWVHYMDVHEPYIAEKDYLSRVDPKLSITKDGMFLFFKDILLKRDVSDKGKVDTLKKLYMAKVAETDDYIRKLFDIFDSYNLLDSSTIIIASDHGDEFSEHRGLSHDGKFYSELIDVPLIIYSKGKERKDIDTTVSLVDIPPTIASLFGIDPAPSFKGKNIIYPSPSIKPYTLYGEAMGKIGHKEKDTDRPTYYMIDSGIKVIYRKEGDIWQAYDTDKDPSDKENIISDISGGIKEKLENFINRNI